jgi:hypothetical protein
MYPTPSQKLTAACQIFFRLIVQYYFFTKCYYGIIDIITSTTRKLRKEMHRKQSRYRMQLYNPCKVFIVNLA